MCICVCICVGIVLVCCSGVLLNFWWLWLGFVGTVLYVHYWVCIQFLGLILGSFWVGSGSGVCLHWCFSAVFWCFWAFILTVLSDSVQQETWTRESGYPCRCVPLDVCICVALTPYNPQSTLCNLIAISFSHPHPHNFNGCPHHFHVTHSGPTWLLFHCVVFAAEKCHLCVGCMVSWVWQWGK